MPVVTVTVAPGSAPSTTGAARGGVRPEEAGDAGPQQQHGCDAHQPGGQPPDLRVGQEMFATANANAAIPAMNATWPVQSSEPRR